jgi:hypothetical protein
MPRRRFRFPLTRTRAGLGDSVNPSDNPIITFLDQATGTTPAPGTDQNLQYLPETPYDIGYNFFTGEPAPDQVAYTTSQSATVNSPTLNTPSNVAQVNQDTQNYLASPQSQIPGSLPALVNSITGSCSGCSFWEIVTGNPASCGGCPMLSTGTEILLGLGLVAIVVIAVTKAA